MEFFVVENRTYGREIIHFNNETEDIYWLKMQKTKRSIIVMTDSYRLRL